MRIAAQSVTAQRLRRNGLITAGTQFGLTLQESIARARPEGMHQIGQAGLGVSKQRRYLRTGVQQHLALGVIHHCHVLAVIAGVVPDDGQVTGISEVVADLGDTAARQPAHSQVAPVVGENLIGLQQGVIVAVVSGDVRLAGEQHTVGHHILLGRHHIRCAAQFKQANIYPRRTVKAVFVEHSYLGVLAVAAVGILVHRLCSFQFTTRLHCFRRCRGDRSIILCRLQGIHFPAVARRFAQHLTLPQMYRGAAIGKSADLAHCALAVAILQGAIRVDIIPESIVGHNGTAHCLHLFGGIALRYVVDRNGYRSLEIGSKGQGTIFIGGKGSCGARAECQADRRPRIDGCIKAPHIQRDPVSAGGIQHHNFTLGLVDLRKQDTGCHCALAGLRGNQFFIAVRQTAPGCILDKGHILIDQIRQSRQIPLLIREAQPGIEACFSKRLSGYDLARFREQEGIGIGSALALLECKSGLPVQASAFPDPHNAVAGRIVGGQAVHPQRAPLARAAHRTGHQHTAQLFGLILVGTMIDQAHQAACVVARVDGSGKVTVLQRQNGINHIVADLYAAHQTASSVASGRHLRTAGHVFQLEQIAATYNAAGVHAGGCNGNIFGHIGVRNGYGTGVVGRTHDAAHVAGAADLSTAHRNVFDLTVVAVVIAGNAADR